MEKAIHCAAMLLALTCASCRAKTNNIFPVTGKVTYNGAPAAGAAIFFYRKGAGLEEHMVMGVIQNDGSFELVCGPLGKGAPPGEYDVLVEWRPVVAQRNGNPQRGPDQLKGRYSDRSRPLLHATVEARANDLPPFDLTD
ncbi:MAG TPA: hypothetical protein VMV10_32275 [Pirellulales bacterium]|nr:hypothetical protein [Pirellulales bacterium]